MVHALAGGRLDGPDARRRAAARVGARPVLVPWTLARRGARPRAVRPAHRGRRDRVPRAAPGWGRADRLGDPPRARLLQRRGRRARRRRVLGRARPEAGRRRRDARRVAVPASPPRHRSPPRPRRRLRGVDRVPLLLHVVRRDRRPRRDPVRDARGRDLQPGSAALRPPGSSGARDPPAGGGRRHGARLRQARAATRRRAVTPRACRRIRPDAIASAWGSRSAARSRCSRFPRSRSSSARSGSPTATASTTTPRSSTRRPRCWSSRGTRSSTRSCSRAPQPRSRSWSVSWRPWRWRGDGGGSTRC